MKARPYLAIAFVVIAGLGYWVKGRANSSEEKPDSSEHRRAFSETFAQFAAVYEPESKPEQIVPLLPRLPTALEESLTVYFDELTIEDTESLLLIHLKLYRYHLENFHQSYCLMDDAKHSVEDQNLLLKAAIQRGMPRTECYLSVSAYEWVVPNANLQNAAVNEELQRIESELARIESGVYWQ